MQRVHTRFCLASVSTLLGTALLLLQLCGAICAFSSCWTNSSESLAVQQKSVHCHGERQPQSGGPQAPKNQPHKCADHETVVMLTNKDSLATALAAFYITPSTIEAFTLPFFSRTLASNHDRWDSHRVPPRVPQHSILRI
jgi:hypothetical protein